MRVGRAAPAGDAAAALGVLQHLLGGEDLIVGPVPQLFPFALNIFVVLVQGAGERGLRRCTTRGRRWLGQ